MKRVTVHVNQIGLVVKNNAVTRMLAAGKYWLGFGEKVDIYDLSGPFQTVHDIDVLLQVDGFRAFVEVVEVADVELCIMYFSIILHWALSAGRYLFCKGC